MKLMAAGLGSIDRNHFLLKNRFFGRIGGLWAFSGTQENNNTIKGQSIMKIYSDKEMPALLGARKEINFYADAITPLHVLGIEAAMHHLVQEGVDLRGYIAIMAHPVTGFAISEKDFHIVDDMEVEVLSVTNHYGNRSLFQKLKDRGALYRFFGRCGRADEKKPLFYYITPFKPSFEMVMKIAEMKKEYQLKVIVTDEGLANYLRNPYAITKSMVPELGVLRTLKSLWDICVEARWFWRRLQKAGMTSEFTLLQGKKGRWMRNEACIEAYKEVLSRNQGQEDFSYYGNAVLINPSLLYETKILKERVDIPIYKEIGQVLKQKGVTMIVKPHPREKQLYWYDELDCIVEKKGSMAQENIFAGLTVLPRCLIGDSSTTLVTASILFDIKAISINRLMNKKCLNDVHYFDNFNRTFSNLIMIPETMEELKGMVCEMISDNPRR